MLSQESNFWWICVLWVCCEVCHERLQCQSTIVRAEGCREMWDDSTWFGACIPVNASKKMFRISPATFPFILQRIRHVLDRDTVEEEPISPEFRLAICLYRLSRGDYYYTIAEMAGLWVSTVCTIVNEVTQAIVDNLVGWMYWPATAKERGTI